MNIGYNALSGGVLRLAHVRNRRGVRKCFHWQAPGETRHASGCKPGGRQKPAKRHPKRKLQTPVARPLDNMPSIKSILITAVIAVIAIEIWGYVQKEFLKKA